MARLKMFWLSAAILAISAAGSRQQQPAGQRSAPVSSRPPSDPAGQRPSLPAKHQNLAENPSKLPVAAPAASRTLSAIKRSHSPEPGEIVEDDRVRSRNDRIPPAPAQPAVKKTKVEPSPPKSRLDNGARTAAGSQAGRLLSDMKSGPENSADINSKPKRRRRRKSSKVDSYRPDNANTTVGPTPAVRSDQFDSYRPPATLNDYGTPSVVPSGHGQQPYGSNTGPSNGSATVRGGSNAGKTTGAVPNTKPVLRLDTQQLHRAPSIDSHPTAHNQRRPISHGSLNQTDSSLPLNPSMAPGPLPWGPPYIASTTGPFPGPNGGPAVIYVPIAVPIDSDIARRYMTDANRMRDRNPDPIQMAPIVPQRKGPMAQSTVSGKPSNVPIGAYRSQSTHARRRPSIDEHTVAITSDRLASEEPTFEEPIRTVLEKSSKPIAEPPECTRRRSYYKNIDTVKKPLDVYFTTGMDTAFARLNASSVVSIVGIFERSLRHAQTNVDDCVVDQMPDDPVQWRFLVLPSGEGGRLRDVSLGEDFIDVSDPSAHITFTLIRSDD